MISDIIKRIETQLVDIGEAEVFEFDVNDIVTLLQAYKNSQELYNETLYQLEHNIISKDVVDALHS